MSFYVADRPRVDVALAKCFPNEVSLGTRVRDRVTARPPPMVHDGGLDNAVDVIAVSQGSIHRLEVNGPDALACDIAVCTPTETAAHAVRR